MASCPECGGKMSGMAEMCPHCGFAMKNKAALKERRQAERHKKGLKRLLIGGVWLVFGLILIAFAVNLLLCLFPLIIGVCYIVGGFLLL